MKAKAALIFQESFWRDWETLKPFLAECRNPSTGTDHIRALSDFYATLYRAFPHLLSLYRITDGMPSPAKTNKTLRAKELITDEQFSFLERLRKLRNQVVKEPWEQRTVTIEEVTEYAVAGSRTYLLAAIRGAMMSLLSKEDTLLLVPEVTRLVGEGVKAGAFSSHDAESILVEIWGWSPSAVLHDDTVRGAPAGTFDHFQMGLLCRVLGNYHRSLVEFNKASKEEPRNDVIWRECGKVCLRLKRNRAAWHYFEKALNLNGSDALNCFFAALASYRSLTRTPVDLSAYERQIADAKALLQKAWDRRAKTPHFHREYERFTLLLLGSLCLKESVLRLECASTQNLTEHIQQILKIIERIEDSEHLRQLDFIELEAIPGRVMHGLRIRDAARNERFAEISGLKGISRRLNDVLRILGSRIS